MITFKHYNKLTKGCRAAWHSLRDEMEGRPYNPNVANFIYDENVVEKFEDEFRDVIANKINRQEGLKNYFQEIYYNGVVKLWLDFNRLGKLRLKHFEEDSMDMLEDSLYTRIVNGYCHTLYLLCDKIFAESLKHHIDLIPYSEVTRRHYNIRGGVYAFTC